MDDLLDDLDDLESELTETEKENELLWKDNRNLGLQLYNCLNDNVLSSYTGDLDRADF